MIEPKLSFYDDDVCFKWESTDNEEAFDKHMSNPKTRAKLIELGYTKESIIYEMDYQGFRNPNDIIINESILALGCSYTYGVGLNRESIWCDILAEKMGLTHYNAGLPGTSADSAYRIARTLIPEHKPKAVFFLVPDRNRSEIISEFIWNGCPFSYSVWSYDNPEFGNYCDFVMDDFPQRLQQERNILAIQQICVDHNIPFHHIVLEELRLPGGIDDDARDLEHSGPRCHNHVADMFYELYQKG